MGEKAGHPFRGNQFTKSKGGTGAGGKWTKNDDRRARMVEKRVYEAGQKGGTVQEKWTNAQLQRVKEEVRSSRAKERLAAAQKNAQHRARVEGIVAGTEPRRPHEVGMTDAQLRSRTTVVKPNPFVSTEDTNGLYRARRELSDRIKAGQFPKDEVSGAQAELKNLDKRINAALESQNAALAAAKKKGHWAPGEGAAIAAARRQFAVDKARRARDRR
jgi:hypothetical protein